MGQLFELPIFGRSKIRPRHVDVGKLGSQTKVKNMFLRKSRTESMSNAGYRLDGDKCIKVMFKRTNMVI